MPDDPRDLPLEPPDVPVVRVGPPVEREDALWECPGCGQEIARGVRRCYLCGERLAGGRRRGGRARRDVEPDRGTLVLVVGVLSLVLPATVYCFPLGLVAGIVAWVLGHIDLGKMAA